MRSPSRIPTWIVAGASGLLLAVAAPAGADQHERPGQPAAGSAAETPRSTEQRAQANAPAAPDDTGRNVRDREGASVTPMDQSNEPRDLELTRKIREAVTSHDQLSTNAQNVKIVTRGGVVTLRGPVDSEQEKQLVESIAQRNAAGMRVESQLEVARDAERGTTPQRRDNPNQE